MQIGMYLHDCVRNRFVIKTVALVISATYSMVIMRTFIVSIGLFLLNSISASSTGVWF